MSQESLAVASRMGRPTVASIEKGRQAVSLHQVVSLADALGLDTSALVAGLNGRSPFPALHSSLSSGDLRIVEELHGALP